MLAICYGEYGPIYVPENGPLQSQTQIQWPFCIGDEIDPADFGVFSQVATRPQTRILLAGYVAQGLPSRLQSGLKIAACIGLYSQPTFRCSLKCFWDSSRAGLHQGLVPALFFSPLGRFGVVWVLPLPSK